MYDNQYIISKKYLCNSEISPDFIWEDSALETNSNCRK